MEVERMCPRCRKVFTLTEETVGVCPHCGLEYWWEDQDGIAGVCWQGPTKEEIVGEDKTGKLKVIVDADLDVKGVDDDYMVVDVITEPEEVPGQDVVMALALAMWDEAKRANPGATGQEIVDLVSELLGAIRESEEEAREEAREVLDEGA